MTVGTARAPQCAESEIRSFRLRGFTHVSSINLSCEGILMTWTKPEAEVVAVTMEVTAYVATL
jgi:hypothetical protein